MPLRLHVYLSPSDELTELRREVDELRSKHQRSVDDLRQAEFRYACEVTINNRILDFCRQNGIALPKDLTERPYWRD